MRSFATAAVLMLALRLCLRPYSAHIHTHANCRAPSNTTEFPYMMQRRMGNKGGLGWARLSWRGFYTVDARQFTCTILIPYICMSLSWAVPQLRWLATFAHPLKHIIFRVTSVMLNHHFLLLMYAKHVDKHMCTRTHIHWTSLH